MRLTIQIIGGSKLGLKQNVVIHVKNPNDSGIQTSEAQGVVEFVN